MSSVSRSVGRPVTRSVLAGQLNNLTQLIKSLFANSEQGFAYDPNDLTTLYQDTAGTVPVTAVGQPVGLMLDKSKNLSTSAELVVNGDFAVSTGWSVAGGGAMSIANGKLIASAVTNDLVSRNDCPATSGKFYKLTVTVSAYTQGMPRVSVGGSLIDVGTGVGTRTFYVMASSTTTMLYVYAGFNGSGGVWEIDSLSIKEVLGNHAYQMVSASRPILRQTPILGNELVVNGDFSDGLTNVAPRNVVTAEIVSGALKVTNTGTFYGFVEMVLPTEVGKTYLFRGDVVAYSSTGAAFHIASVTNGGDIAYNVEGSTAAVGVMFTAQTANTYLSLKTPNNVIGSWRIFDNISVREVTGYRTDQNYLAFDGTDDFLQTNNIDFTATDKVSLFAGVRKLSDANFSIVTELSASINANNGTFYLAAPASSGTYEFATKGTVARTAAKNGIIAPHSAVLNAQGNIGLDITKLNVNGISTITNSDQGTGNYGNYPLYIGRRGGTSLPFNGHLYSMVGIGRLTTDSETIALEEAIAKNTGVTLNV